ncbi:ABC transporter permease [Mycolicibacterium sp. Y3]
MSSRSRQDLAAAAELRTLADSLGAATAAAAAAEWGDDTALRAEAAKARSTLATLTQLHDDAIAEAPAEVVHAVRRARVAVAEAVVKVAQARAVNPSLVPPVRPSLSGGARRVADEVRHIVADRPRAVLLRIVITLGVSLSLVAFYHLTGLTRYDAGRLTLYLFAAVVGSVVCTNALCFEADRVRRALVAGDPVWRVLVTKNLAIAAAVLGAGLPVITVLAVAGDGNFVAMVDQLLTMVFIWLGAANVLSVVYPLRHEPISARLHDGTWLPFAFSFALSYGVGLTVNLMIYWRLWSRQTASRELVCGDWAAFALVLGSALSSWVLLTVFAVTCSRHPRLRARLSREMVAYQKN